MTDPLEAHGDALRRALHAEADAWVPTPDALDRIRERTARVPFRTVQPIDLFAAALLLAILLFTLRGA